MRHHRFPNWRGTPPLQLQSGRAAPLGVTHNRGSALEPAPTADAVHELRDLIGWLRQRLRGEHTVRACVLTMETAGPDSYLLLLGEAQASLSHDPPRMKVRLDGPELARIRAEYGADFDPADLINRTIAVQLRTGLRQRFGRGAGVQAKLMALLSLGQIPLEAELERECTLQRLRLEGARFGPDSWVEPEDLHQVALVVSEHGEARRDVEHVLQPLEGAGLLRLHRVWANFEGAGAERTLVEAFTRVASLHAEYGLSATLVCRGGGPIEAFRPLNSYAVARAATADRLPNLIVGLGHAGTPRTALDAVAARSEPTPTAAAMLVRHLVERTGVRAERALAAFEAAIEEDLGAAGRIALARATTAFDAALQDLVTAAEARLQQLDRAVEQSLLSKLSAAADGIARKEPDADPVEVGPPGDTEDDALLSEALLLVIATDTGCLVTRAQDLSAGLPLLLQFPDGAVPVRVELSSSTTH
ncbi:Exonuclease VII large subunit-like protein [Methylorubrum populi BJ001]|jgi:exodeoxyribonuclease VII large subunit|uniref:Exonuclease VII large subunit-like protein n=1 Tax=Methylorubrum populi (strain ATCC BAA-705 / NCIMB 13946 / BJ001) TaxID=441620 RepID=B1ZI22_METPB|nr:exodeoxyribonuclease VII large subunit [Methylorubrum populi]ACB78508.1 Exonuclease VII large subunit-like protein [Methylorubrum populi BJ001]OAH35140.1 exonuclease VII large subunit [Methylorubrum populi]PZP65508.1 MAG: exonuclease VII large subunit [Methylorubrum populi]